MKRTGFTLLELLVVLAVIALLLALATEALRMSRERGKALLCRSNVRQLTLGLFMYADENGTFPQGFRPAFGGGLDDHLGSAISGFLADGRILVDMGRVKAQIYKLTYDEPLNVMGAVKEIADRMQMFTQYGGVRPFGVAFLLGGIDEKGPQLFEVDPSSAYYGWKAQAIGRGAPEALKLLKKS